MKLLSIFSAFLVLALFSGCASNGGAGASTASNGEEAAEEPAEERSTTGTRTAYEGSTGPRLLMERYKTGEIEGYQD